MRCNWQHIVFFLTSVVQLLSHILERVVFACTLGYVALAGRLCVVVVISEHAVRCGLEVVEMFFLRTDCLRGTYTHR